MNLPNYSRDSILDYLLYSSKQAFKANKIFYILYLKEVVEKNIPLAYLESMIKDLKHCKENSFANNFCNKIKKKLSKLLKIIWQYNFDFKKDSIESNLLINRIKS